MNELASLPLGAPLPSQHQLMSRTGYAYETVSRALRELSFEGFIRRRRGQGSFVCRRPKDLNGTLRYWLLDGEATGPILQTAAREFVQEHPLVELQDLTAKRKQFAEADVVQVSSSSFIPLADGFATLSPEISERAERHFHPKALDAVRVHGELRGLPVIVSPQVLFVNEELLTSTGREIPASPHWTWEALLDLVRAFHAPERGLFGWSSPRDLQTVAPFIWQHGGRLFDDVTHACKLAERSAIEALRYWLELERHSPYPSAPVYGSSHAFCEGRAAFLASGGAVQAKLGARCRFRWRTVPLPVGRMTATSLRFTALAVRRFTPMRQAAEAFAEHMLADATQRRLVESGIALPSGRMALGKHGALLQTHFEALEHARPHISPEVAAACTALTGSLAVFFDAGMTAEAGAHLLALIADGAQRAASIGLGAPMPAI